MAAISNSSPLIVYANAGHFDLLRSVFDELYIPPAVWFEVVEQGHGQPGVEELSNASWITVRNLPASSTVANLHEHLDLGEAQAIALAMESAVPLPILLDDGTGRRFARALHLEVVGSAGVLIRAKEYGLIEEVRPILMELRDAGLRLGRSAYDQALALAGEA